MTDKPGGVSAMSAELGQLPEPVAWQHEDGCGSFISHEVKKTHKPSGRWPHYYSRPLYDQAALKAAVAAERERCATICDELESIWTALRDTALLNGDIALSNAHAGEPRAARLIKAQILGPNTKISSA